METGLTPTFYVIRRNNCSPFKMPIFGNLIPNSHWFNLILWRFSRFSYPVEARTGPRGTFVLHEGERPSWHAHASAAPRDGASVQLRPWCCGCPRGPSASGFGAFSSHLFLFLPHCFDRCESHLSYLIFFQYLVSCFCGNLMLPLFFSFLGCLDHFGDHFVAHKAAR